MIVVFDENVPRPLREFLPRHEIKTLQELGWSGIGNGELVQRVDKIFDVLVLADKNLRYQQDGAKRRPNHGLEAHATPNPTGGTPRDARATSDAGDNSEMHPGPPTSACFLRLRDFRQE